MTTARKIAIGFVSNLPSAMDHRTPGKDWADIAIDRLEKVITEAQDAARLEARDVIRAIIVREAEESTYEESRWDAEHLCDILDALTPEQLRKP